MTTIIFEAHGTTFDNEQGLASGHNDVNLSPLGEEQAKNLGKRYQVHSQNVVIPAEAACPPPCGGSQSVDAIFCSDLSRSYRTAEIAFEGRDIPIIQDARLRECDYGEWTQRPSKDVEAERIDRISVPFPGGESYAQTSLRMLDFLNEISQKYDGKTIMIIGHRATQYGLERWINAVPLKESAIAPWSWQPGWTYHLWKKVEIKTPRGITLSGHLYARDPKKIVITSHGFTSDQFGKSTLLAKALALHDISALTFDFSGCGESQDDTISVAKEVEDLSAVVEYAQSLGYEHIGIMGTSLGGLIAQKVWSPAIATLVLWCPVTHPWDAEERFTPEQRAELDRNGYLVIPREQSYLRMSVRVDRDNVEERAHINTKELVSHVSCPVLIIHGDNDTVVPLADSREALTYLSRDSRLEIIKGADHFFMKERDELITRSAQWFAESLH